MNCMIIYWSRYGHGKKIVDRLADRLEKNQIQTNTYKPDDVDPNNIPEADIYVFSTPAEMFRIKKEMRNFMKNLEDVEGKNYGIINTHGMKRNWLKNMDKILSKKKMKKIAEEDFQIAKEETEKGEGLPEDWEAELDIFAEKLIRRS
ncbi:MAG: flavodoxin family protein [Candidatus Saliniplasma sp.]